MKRNEILCILHDIAAGSFCECHAPNRERLQSVIAYLESLRADVKLVGMAYSPADKSFVITEPSMPKHGAVRIEVLASHPDNIAAAGPCHAPD